MKAPKRVGWTATAAIIPILVCSQAYADFPDPDSVLPASQSLPPALIDVGIDEHLENSIPLEAEFRDEADRPVRLSEFFRAGKPVLLNFAYYRCPMLCNLVLAGMVEALKKSEWTPGKEFEVVTVSIDSKEGGAQAAAKKKSHIEALGRPEAASGWHFLTGTDRQIRRLADAIGFRYHYNPASEDFSHSAAIYAISPRGKICRYLYGVAYPPQDLHLALLEAKDGKALSVGEKLLLFCYHYDADAKGYVLFAKNSMRIGGYLVLGALLLLLGGLWRRELKSRKENPLPRPEARVGKIYRQEG
ncbi:MAG: SCO family protein [Fibrobacteres bacterium]|nr:SCO family protein [Fibrobacterota bacterium]